MHLNLSFEIEIWRTWSIKTIQASNWKSISNNNQDTTICLVKKKKLQSDDRGEGSIGHSQNF